MKKKKAESFNATTANIFAKALTSSITGLSGNLTTTIRADEEYKYTTHIKGRYSKIDAEFDEKWMMKSFLGHIIENADLEDFAIIIKMEKKT